MLAQIISLKFQNQLEMIQSIHHQVQKFSVQKPSVTKMRHHHLNQKHQYKTYTKKYVKKGWKGGIVK